MNDAEILKELLRTHGKCKIKTKGRSMKPMLFTGDFVILSTPDREIKKGDVVLYDGKDETYTLHRVIGYYEDGYVIRGDNTFFKEYVRRDRILAYLVSYEHKAKAYSVTSFGYKFYSWFWNFIYPIRAFFNKLRGLLSKIKRKIKKCSSNK